MYTHIRTIKISFCMSENQCFPRRERRRVAPVHPSGLVRLPSQGPCVLNRQRVSNLRCQSVPLLGVEVLGYASHAKSLLQGSFELQAKGRFSFETPNIVPIALVGFALQSNLANRVLEYFHVYFFCPRGFGWCNLYGFFWHQIIH